MSPEALSRCSRIRKRKRKITSQDMPNTMGRYWFSQRVFWDGDWKLVWNGFDMDELYNLKDDPWEKRNLIGDPDCYGVIDKMMSEVWNIVERTSDESLLRTGYH
jgi:arylsulfatase A-like enzyme